MTTNETPRTDALRMKMAQLGWPSDGEPVAMLMASHGQLERELAALAFDAARLEWKYGRNDDGTPKNWAEWDNLRASLGEYVRQPQELEREDAIRLSSVNRELAAQVARLERELEQERQDRRQADLDAIRALGERNDARRELAEANRKLAALPRSGLAFGSLLARYGIVQSAALDDPEGYDGYATLDALYAAFEELTGVVENEAGDPP